MNSPFLFFVRLPDGTLHQVCAISFDRRGAVRRIDTFSLGEKPLGAYYTIEGDDLDRVQLLTRLREPAEELPR